MNYLERNAAIIAEIRDQSLVRGKMVGHSNKTATTSVGSYISTVIEAPLYVALKETFGPMDTPKERVSWDLAFATLIYDNIPALQPELPLFIGLATDKSGQAIGQLTEDFTKGGRHLITDIFTAQVTKIGSPPQDLKELIGGEHNGLPHLIEDSELAHMFFNILIDTGYSKRRIGDFDSAWTYMSFWGNPPRDLCTQIQRDLDQYTLRCQLTSRFGVL